MLVAPSSPPSLIPFLAEEEDDDDDDDDDDDEDELELVGVCFISPPRCCRAPPVVDDSAASPSDAKRAWRKKLGSFAPCV